jgi:hypothetical protein
VFDVTRFHDERGIVLILDPFSPYVQLIGIYFYISQCWKNLLSNQSPIHE